MIVFVAFQYSPIGKQEGRALGFLYIAAAGAGGLRPLLLKASRALVFMIHCLSLRSIVLHLLS
jgi:hypothetical protein